MKGESKAEKRKKAGNGRRRGSKNVHKRKEIRWIEGKGLRNENKENKEGEAETKEGRKKKGLHEKGGKGESRKRRPDPRGRGVKEEQGKQSKR